LSSPKPKISVVVCTYNRSELLGEALQSLAEQTLDTVLFEVLVINNNSTDDTQELAEEFAASHGIFRVFIETAQGLSHARNRGWKEALGEYVAYIDDDAKAAPDWCENILRAFETVKPKPTAVGGEILPWYEDDPPDWFTDDFEIRTCGPDAGYLQPPWGKFGFYGSNMAIPRDVLEALGGFSVDFGMAGSQMRMGEDTEFFLRLSEGVARYWYDPKIKVFHWVPKRNMRMSYRFLRNFKYGAAMVAIEGRRLSAREYLKGMADICWILVRSVVSLPRAGGTLKRQAAKELQELGRTLGTLFGKSS